MPESKLLSDSYDKSADAPSIQEIGFHVVGARTLGGESDRTEASAPESNQQLVTADVGPAGHTADIDGSTIASDEFVNDGENDVSETHIVGARIPSGESDCTETGAQANPQLLVTDIGQAGRTTDNDGNTTTTDEFINDGENDVTSETLTVKARTPGGELESDRTEASVQESPQLLITDIGPARCTMDIDRNTITSNEFINNGEDDVSGMINLAVLLMAECKAGLSLSELNNMVSLFRQVTDSRPTTHLLHRAAKRDLASALGIRFMYTNERNDLMESLTLRSEMAEGGILEEDMSPETNTTLQIDDKMDREDTLELAKGLLTDFQKSTSLHVLNTIVFLLQQALAQLSAASTSQLVALITLADALYARFNHSYDLIDLNEAISSLQDASKCRMERDRNINFRVSGLLATRFDLTGNLSDLQTAFHWALKGRETSTGILESLQFAIELRKRHTMSGNMADLNTAVELFREGIAELPQESEIYSYVVGSLASALLTRFGQGGQQSDLDEAISLFWQGLELRLPPHPDRSSLLTDLASALFTQFEQGGQRGDLDEAISLYRQALELFPPPHPNHSGLLNNLACVLLTRFGQEGQQSDLDEAISLHRQALKLHLPPHPNRSGSLNNLANALLTQYEQGGQQSDLDEAISLYRQTLELQLPSHPDQSGPLNNLAKALLTRFKQGGQQSDLEEAISLHRQALELSLPSHPNHSGSLNNLGHALLIQFGQGGQQSDLDEAISLCRQALELQLPSHPNRSSSLNNLASALSTQFKQGGQQSDLNEAIYLYRQALKLQPPPHPDRSMSLNNLANALSTQFEQGGQQSDLNEAISLYRQALELQLPPHHNQSGLLHNLASTLQTRFQHGGQQSDLDEAISLHRQALELRLPPHPNRSGSLSNLASALLTQFKQGGQQSDLNEAISLHRQALELQPPPHPDQSSSLNNLASALLIRFEQEGQQSDLEEGISLHKQALELFLPYHPDRSSSLNNLASALLTQFGQKGQQSDIDEAISLHRQALELHPPPHPDRSIVLNNLATALSIRFGQGDQQSDLNEAISLYRQAVELRLPPHPDQSSSLNNLASALLTRFEQGGQQSDLNEAISLHRQALELRLPPHPHQSSSLNNLANALLTQFAQEGQQSDLQEAISLLRQALKLRPPSHPDRSSSLTNLASALLTQFGQGYQQSDLDEAISLVRQTLELRLPPHPNRSSSLNYLANTLLTRYEQEGQQSDLDEAMALFLTATQYSFQSPSNRLYIARRWIDCADRNKHSSAIDAYEASIQALPLVAALSLDVASRQRSMTAGSDGLARNAARCAILSGHLDKAIELLEAGRSIFWSQALSLRSPFDQLYKIAPELADKLQEIATQLEIGSYRDVFSEVLDNRKKLFIDQEAARLNRLNEEWAQSIQEVRKLSGFEDFLCPSRLSSLKAAASEHPVVILIANDDESHCLIMTSTNIHHIPLPNLGTPKLKKLAHIIRIAASQSPIRSLIDQSQDIIIRLLGEEQAGRVSTNTQLRSSDGMFKFVLRVLWDELVKPVIDLLNIKKSDEMAVLQWCPTGHFTFLPIHAAGCYDDALAIDCAPDYFISSYTPTIGALLALDSAPTTQSLQMMVVIQSKGLPSTKRELANIRKHVSCKALIELGIPEAPAGVETVASHLSNVSIVHFACHGSQDPWKPLDSGLKLDDGLLQISRIMKEKMPNGSLAFLCACETAMGDKNLPDEAMSIGASLIFSGFQQVIATMWKMMDEDGPIIADKFYEELFFGSSDGRPALKPDVTKSALALHLAVKKLRSQSVSFQRWVPFIHMGK